MPKKQQPTIILKKHIQPCPLPLVFNKEPYPLIKSIPRNYITIDDPNLPALLQWIYSLGETTFLLTPSHMGIKRGSSLIGYNKLETPGIGYTFMVGSPNGWAYISTRNTELDCVGSGIEMLGELLKLCPSLRREVTTDGEEWHEKSRQFYDANSPTAFVGIPDPSYNGLTLENVRSLDIHWAFPAALARIRPTIAPVIEDLFRKRKEASSKQERNKAKAIGNFAIGAMTSRYITRLRLPARGLAKLRYEILEEASKRINMLRSLLEQQGATILNMRTDSIKFIWRAPYEPKLPYEGSGLGEWSYEWKGATYRQISTSKYEYIVDGVYRPVLSGLTKLDAVKPRSQWQWGDILHHDAQALINYTINDNLEREVQYINPEEPNEQKKK